MLQIKTFLQNMSIVEEEVNMWLEENADKKVIDIPKKSKPNIFDRLCQVDKEFNTKLKAAIAKNSLAPI